MAVASNKHAQPAAPAEGEAAGVPVAGNPASRVAPALSSVTLVVAPAAIEKLSADARFSNDRLLDSIKGELRARKLLDESGPAAGGTVDIVIDDCATRPTSNAVLFGYLFSTGTMTGGIRVRDADGTDARDLRIAAEARISVPAASDTGDSLQPLYRRFAAMAADGLAGTPGRADLARSRPTR